MTISAQDVVDRLRRCWTWCPASGLFGAGVREHFDSVAGDTEVGAFHVDGDDAPAGMRRFCFCWSWSERLCDDGC